VRNLPLTVNSSQLQHFFSKHGQVSTAKIICYNKTKTSQGRGIVTLATVHAHRADALAALNGLGWDGYNLKVSLVNENRQ
jgi:RNA recognition motif-containing protein